MTELNILAISGSLRAASYNTAVLQAAVKLAPAGMQLRVYEGLGSLPLFNPDLDSQPPETVRQWRSRLEEADALLIASPEYAHGVSGPLKNALDWAVSSEQLPGVPAGVLNTSPRAFHAYLALQETLTTMSVKLIPGASLSLPLLGSGLDAAGILGRPDLIDTIRAALQALMEPAMERRATRR